jgi:hypothetical protein
VSDRLAIFMVSSFAFSQAREVYRRAYVETPTSNFC